MKAENIRKQDRITHRQYAYIRVSSKEQNWNRQLDRIKELRIPEKNIYCEKMSGKDFKRKKYQELKKKMREGDTLVITGLDRLGRNYLEIKEEWQSLNQKKINIKVLDMPILDTKEQNDFIKCFVSQIVLEILSFVAEQERRNIKERQREGIEAAKRRGVIFGRPKKQIKDFPKWIKQYKKKEVTVEEICQKNSISKSTFYRTKKKWEMSKEHK